MPGPPRPECGWRDKLGPPEHATVEVALGAGAFGAAHDLQERPAAIADAEQVEVGVDDPS
jgi:hypothetical protein